MCLTLKKFKKILKWFFLSILFLLLSIWIFVQTPFGQNWISRQVTSRLSKDLNTRIRIDRVGFSLFNTMHMNGVLVEDHQQDTLLYAGELKVNITDWFFFKDNIVLKYIGLSNATIYTHREDSVWNYQFLIDYFSSPSSGKSSGGTALDAVEASVRSLEDNPLFNAGKGAVFTNAGKNELDAAIMDGSTLKAGSIAGVTTIRNPITAARNVMEGSEHVLLTGKGAEDFAKMRGLEIVDPSYFYTEARWQGLLQARAADSLASLKAGNPGDTAQSHGLKQLSNRDYKYGTVGAVALDQHGNLAAATSTGGMTNKKYGRVGDAPIIGAGTYANNKTVAISCTGWGEYYIRLVMAKTISDMMEFGKQTLDKAATEMVMNKLPELGGDGGLIGVDRNGNITMPFCTEGMYRGFVKEGGKKTVLIYKP